MLRYEAPRNPQRLWLISVVFKWEVGFSEYSNFKLDNNSQEMTKEKTEMTKNGFFFVRKNNTIQTSIATLFFKF